MNCTSATELLPWFLSGTLDDAERRAVEKHLAGCDSCREELERTREAASLFAAHPPGIALVDYVAGRGGTGIPAATLEEHLELCPTCAEEVALLRASHARSLAATAPRAAAGGKVLAGRWPAARWRQLAMAASLAGLAALGAATWSFFDQQGTGEELAARLEGAERRAAELARDNEGLRRERQEVEARVNELAAQVAAASGTASELEAQLAAEQRRLAELERRGTRLAMGLPVEILARAETVRRGENPLWLGQGQPPKVARSAGLAVLSLPLPDGVTATAIRLEVSAGDGREVLSERGPPPAKNAFTYTVVVPIEKLAAGRYALRLWDDSDGERELLGTYELEVE